MQITVYDSNHSNEEVDLNVNVLDQVDFNTLWDSSATSFIYDGITYSITRRSSDQFRFLEFYQTSTNLASITELELTLNAAGLPGDISEEDSVQKYYETSGTSTFRKDTSGTSEPYIGYSYQNNTYSTTLFQRSGQSYQATNKYGKVTAFYANDELYWIGLINVDIGIPNDPFTRITIAQNSGISTTTYVEVLPSAGDTGFKPIKDTNKYGRGGGKKSGQTPRYESDTLEQPGAPDESVASLVGSGYVNLYKITKANLAQVGHCLFGDTLWTWFQGLTLGDPLDGIISLCVFPYEPLTGAAEYVKLFKYSCTTASLGANAQGNPLTNQYRTIPFGTINVGEMFESYLDYEATSISLYLPFIGEVDIPISEVMGGTISVEYTIDFCTGACTANVLCSKNISLEGIYTDTQYAQHAYQGNCACQIPLTSASYGSMVGSMINACASGLSGNVAGAVMGFTTDALNGALTPTIKTKGTISANSGFCAVLYPYITITRPITAEPENYQEVIGYPSFMDATLATCQGLCVCDDINLSGLTGATDSEISRIKQMCKEGIYI